MMKNTKKAFTLVELIVVITILAILGTIAFISLQGYSGEAKNSKVISDLRNIASAIETVSTRKSIILTNILTNSGTTNRLTAVTFNSGSTLTTPSTDYWVGNVDFAIIGQNGEDFTDPNSTGGTGNYLFSVLTNPDFKGYQLAGQIIENDVKKTRITGTHYRVNIASDTNGLIRSAASTSTTTPVTDGDALPTGSTNLY